MKKELANKPENELTGNDLRPQLLAAMEKLRAVRSLCDEIHENDNYGHHFDNKLSMHLDELTQISLTLGAIYGYTLADDVLENREVF